MFPASPKRLRDGVQRGVQPVGGRDAEHNGQARRRGGKRRLLAVRLEGKGHLKISRQLQLSLHGDPPVPEGVRVLARNRAGIRQPEIQGGFGIRR